VLVILSLDTSFTVELTRNCRRQYCGESNSEAWTSTHDGVDVCGKRLAEEIEVLIEKENLPKGTKLTLAGHSFGGLMVRYAAGHLWSANKLQHFEPEVTRFFVIICKGLRVVVSEPDNICYTALRGTALPS